LLRIISNPKSDVESDVAHARRRRQIAAPRNRNSRIPRVCEGYGCSDTPTGSRSFAESSGETAVAENAGPGSGPLWVAPDLGDLVRLLSDLPEGQRQALVSLMRHAAGG
jgi:hypothetical protein